MKRHKSGIQVLIAACDEDLLGSHFIEGRFHLRVIQTFYDGHRVDEASLVQALRGCTMANLVGSKTVDAAVACGIIQPENVATVDGVPHAQYMYLDV